MTQYTKYLFRNFAICILLLSLLSIGNKLSAQVQFRSFQSIEAIMQAAQKENKGIFIDGYTDWCYWCKVLDKTTFADSAIGEFINQHFVAVKLNMETDSLGLLIAQKYCINGFPTVLLLNHQFQLIDKLIGYRNQDLFMSNVAASLNRLQHDSIIQGFSTSFTIQYPDIYSQAFAYPLSNRKFADSATINAFIATRQNLADEPVFVTMQRYAYLLNDDALQKIISQSDAIKKMFGLAAFDDLIENLLAGRLQAAIAERNKAAFDNALHIAEHLSAADNRKFYHVYYSIEFFKTTNNFEQLTPIINKALSDSIGWLDASRINDIAWHYYEHCNDKNMLRQAVGWMKNHVIHANDLYEFADTYAALLYKLGQLQEARSEALKAIELGKQQNKDVQGTQQLLAKIEAAMKRKK